MDAIICMGPVDVEVYDRRSISMPRSGCSPSTFPSIILRLIEWLGRYINSNVGILNSFVRPSAAAAAAALGTVYRPSVIDRNSPVSSDYALCVYSALTDR